MERALLRFFSVPVMLKTLFSHWHKDRVSYRQGSIGGMVQALIWNVISRLMGMIVRLVVLSTWVVSQVVLAVLAVGSLLIFLIAPVAVVIGIVMGIVLVIGY